MTQIKKKLSQEKLKKNHIVKWRNNFYSRKECKKSNLLPPSVYQFLSSSAILINMLINTLIDSTASDNCKMQAEIKSNAANSLFKKQNYCLVNHNWLFFPSFPLNGKVAI